MEERREPLGPVVCISNALARMHHYAMWPGSRVCTVLDMGVCEHNLLPPFLPMWPPLRLGRYYSGIPLPKEYTTCTVNSTTVNRCNC